MALYFDGVHLMSDDNLQELHDFAVHILGLKKSWFQKSPPKSFPHYDVFGYKKRRLISQFTDQVEILDNRLDVSAAMHRYWEKNGRSKPDQNQNDKD